MKIIHIINGLDNGGAELSLFNICKYDKKNQHIVISFFGTGIYKKKLKKNKNKVYCLNIINIYQFDYIFKIFKILINEKPDLIQTWMPLSHLVGSVIGRLAGFKKIFWNIRHSNLPFSKTYFLTIIILRLLSILSYFIPKFIIVNSKKSLAYHSSIGFCKRKMFLIYNGYDFSNIKNLKIDKYLNKKISKFSQKKIALFGRYEPIKGHETLINAISLLKKENFHFKCFLISPNVSKVKSAVHKSVEKLGIKKYILFRNGSKLKFQKIMREIDILVLASLSEGFPNIVAEAMSYGIPTIVTNVGDAKYIVGNTGWVVQPNKPKKLSLAIKKALNEVGSNKYYVRSKNAHQRIKNKFKINQTISLYNKAWYSII